MINVKELEKKIQKVLDIEFLEEGFVAELKETDNKLFLSIDICDFEEGYKCILDNFYEAACEISEITNEEEALRFLINDIYRQRDKDKRIIRTYKGKIERRLKQLSNAVVNRDDDKVIKINVELISLYREKNEAKYNWDECRMATHILHMTIDEIMRESR